MTRRTHFLRSLQPALFLALFVSTPAAAQAPSAEWEEAEEDDVESSDEPDDLEPAPEPGAPGSVGAAPVQAGPPSTEDAADERAQSDEVAPAASSADARHQADAAATGADETGTASEARGGVTKPHGEPTPVPGVATPQSPVGGADAPRSLVAEGSNYWRPVRRGLSWWGFAQAQYHHSQLSEDQLAPGGAPLNRNQFELRRARLRIDHGWENVAATLEMDGSTVSGLGVGVRRAEASLLHRGAGDEEAPPLIVVTAGVTDLPFGAELGESQRDRVFMERSIGSLALFPSEADIGVKVWGAYRFVNYAAAVVNGQPLNGSGFTRDPNAAKDVVGRVGARASIRDDLRLDGGLSVYTGRGFSPGRDATKDSIVWVDENNSGTAEPYEFIGVTGSAAIPSRNFERWALGLDVGAVLDTRLGQTRLNGEVVVASNMDRNLFVSDPVLISRDARQLLLTLSLVQQITDHGLIGLRAAYYDPDSDLIEQRAGVFHLRDQTFWVLSPTVGITLPHGRLVAQYDFIRDLLGRDTRGVPADVRNDQLTIRLQVDL